MNNKGFTLIELIATLALLAVISVISFVSITSVVNKSKISNCESLVKNIKMAAKEYASDNRYNGITNGKFKVEILMSKNYLKGKNGKLVDPFTKTDISSNDVSFEIVLNINDYSVEEVNVYNKDDLVVDCQSGKW